MGLLVKNDSAKVANMYTLHKPKLHISNMRQSGQIYALKTTYKVCTKLCMGFKI